MLFECRPVDISAGDQFKPEFLAFSAARSVVNKGEET
jgi:hypothetical protein